ncbi:MAG: 50S ribosomal protein L17 [Oligoflexia bacterium]|nr:50S ribosomal protein L17 [Oligoflexia bacterium]
MRHQNYKYRIGTTTAHRKALLANLSASMIESGKIKTTITKCRSLRSFIEKLVTLAKEDSVQRRRLVLSRLRNKQALKKLFADIAPKYKTRPGGYTRITKLPDARVGDGAQVAYISFVE